MKKAKDSNLTKSFPAILSVDDILSKNGFFPIILDQQILHHRRVWGGHIACCMLCTKGEASFTMDAIKYTIKAGEALIIDSDFFLMNKSVSRDFKAYAIMATKFFLFSPTFPLAFDLHFFILRNPTLALDKETIRQLTGTFDMLLQKSQNQEMEYTFMQSSFDKHIMCQLAKTFCYEMYNQFRKTLPYGQAGSKASNKETIVLRFINLLHKHVVHERHITFYSDALDITPQYLATILKNVTGLSTNQWMHIMIIEKAKHLLLTQNKNIQEVAKELNYPDQSTFGKMFKAETGMSPIQFKKEVSLKQ